MHSSGIRPIRVLISVLAVAVAAFVLLWASSDRTAQATNNFDIGYNLKNCNILKPGYPDSFKSGGATGIPNMGGADTGGVAGVADCAENLAGTETLATNVLSDQSTVLCIPGRAAVTSSGMSCPASSFAPNLGSKNFGAIINYVPGGYQINGMAAGDGFGTDLAPGELVGGGANVVNLQAAVQSGDCSTGFQVSFVFYNVPLPNVGTPGAPSVFGNPDPRTATNIAWPRLEGDTDRFGHWVVGNGTTDPGGHSTTDNMVDAGSDDVGDPTSIPLADYPKFLLDQFDPDYLPGVGDNVDGGVNLPPAIPIALYGGVSIPTGASTDWVPLYFVQFAPGQLANGAGLWTGTHPYAKAVAALGYPNVAILNDPTAVKGSISSIQDFCSTVFSMNILFGQGAGADGNISTTGDNHDRFKTPTSSGTYFYENWVMSQRDADGDGRENAYDTCPWNDDSANYPDPDLDNDGIYDTCDPFPAVAGCDSPDLVDLSNNDCDVDFFHNRQDTCPQAKNGADGDPGGKQLEAELSQLAYPADGGPKTDGIGDVCDSEGGGSDTLPNGDFQIRGKVTAKCIGGTDADGDGYCAADKDAGTDSGAGAATKHNAWTSPLTLVDTDADTVGVKSDFQETFMGTDEAKRCAADITANNEGLPDRWSYDFNDDRKAALSDILAYIPVFNVVGNPRFDQNQDGVPSLSDILSFIPVFNVSCVP